MDAPGARGVTELLADWSRGDRVALDQLIPIVYDELHRRAGQYLAHERADHTLQATALVNEAYLKLVDQRFVRWQNRAHFFGIAARLMRRILVDHARRRAAVKRGNGEQPLSLIDVVDRASAQLLDVIQLDRLLVSLAELDTAQCRIVELRFFAGLTVEETATVLGSSATTVKRQWRAARAWLYRELQQEPGA